MKMKPRHLCLLLFLVGCASPKYVERWYPAHEKAKSWDIVSQMCRAEAMQHVGYLRLGFKGKVTTNNAQRACLYRNDWVARDECVKNCHLDLTEVESVPVPSELRKR